MPYIGNTPADKFLTLAKQSFSTSATTSYTLDSSISSTQDIALFINNVRQSPVDAYTVSGTALTLTSATAGTDEMYCVYLGKTVGTVNPPNNSVGLNQLSATGTKSSSTFLAGDNSFKTVAGTTINNNADNRVITGSGTANTLEGESALTFSSPSLKNVTASSGATASGESDELVLEGTAEVGMSILSATSGSGSVFFGDSGANGQGRLVYYHGDDSMRFVTNSSEGMRIASDGDVLIGTYSAIHSGGEKLAVNGASSSLPILTLGVTHTSVFGGVKFRNGNGEIGSVTYNASGVAYNTSSDYRLKENETPITDGITRLKTLKPYRFNFKTDPDETVDGFFAHEVSNVVPEAISGTKDAMHPEVLYTADDELPEGKEIGDVKEETKINPQGIDQAKLVPLLTKALQEAITKIETLETKVTALENK